MAVSAARILSLASPTALSGRPTSSRAGVPPEICTWTSTGTASMPEKANVRTRAIVAAESRAVRAWRPEQLRECRVYRRMMNAMVKGDLAGSPGLPM